MGKKKRVEDDIISNCIDSKADARKLYDESYINHRESTANGTYWMEGYAEVICDNFNKLRENITGAEFEHYNKKSYAKLSSERKKVKYGVKDDISKLSERQLEAKLKDCFTDRNFGSFGKVVFIQAPLENKRGTSKIDIVFESEDTMYIGELKKHDSKESVLRAALEAFTYLLLCKGVGFFKVEKAFKPIILLPYSDTQEKSVTMFRQVCEINNNRTKYTNICNLFEMMHLKIVLIDQNANGKIIIKDTIKF